METKTGRKAIAMGFLITIIGGICWGGSSTCGQFLMQQRGIDAGWLVCVRLLIAGVLILTIVSMQNRSVKYIFAVWTDWKTVIHIILFGLVGMYLTQYTYYVACDLSNSGTATVLEYLSPLFVMLYMSMVRRKLPGKTQLLALALAIFGTFLLATHGSFTSLSISTAVLIWGILSAITLAANNLLPVGLMKRFGTLRTVGWGQLIGGLIMLPIYKPWACHYSWDLSAVLALCVSVLIGTAFAYLAFMEGVRRIGPEKASMLACVEPVSATFFTVVCLHTTFQPMDLAGIVSIVLAVTILSVRDARHPEET